MIVQPTKLNALTPPAPDPPAPAERVEQGQFEKWLADLHRAPSRADSTPTAASSSQTARRPVQQAPERRSDRSDPPDRRSRTAGQAGETRRTDAGDRNPDRAEHAAAEADKPSAGHDQSDRAAHLSDQTHSRKSASQDKADDSATHPQDVLGQAPDPSADDRRPQVHQDQAAENQSADVAPLSQAVVAAAAAEQVAGREGQKTDGSTLPGQSPSPAASPQTSQVQVAPGAPQPGDGAVKVADQAGGFNTPSGLSDGGVLADQAQTKDAAKPQQAASAPTHDTVQLSQTGLGRSSGSSQPFDEPAQADPKTNLTSQSEPQSAVATDDSRAQADGKPVQQTGGSSGQPRQASSAPTITDLQPWQAVQEAGRTDGQDKTESSDPAVSSTAGQTGRSETQASTGRSAPVHLVSDLQGQAPTIPSAATPVESNAGQTGQAGTLVFLDPMDQQHSQQIMQRAMSGIRGMMARRGGTIQMRLSPPDLGTLRIEVKITAGAVRASFQASSLQAGHVLTENLASLRQALESHGLRVEHLAVQTPLGSHQASTAAGHDQAQHQADQAADDGRSRGAFDQQGSADRHQSGGQRPQDRPAFHEQLVDVQV